MGAFRTYLAIVVACLGTYTMIVGLNHGWNLLPVFFGDMATMTWPGQFNFDFMSFLALSVCGLLGGTSSLPEVLHWESSASLGA